MKAHFRMMAAYNQWANARIYDAASELTEEEYNRDMGAFFKSVMGTLNHIVTADRIWLKRFTGQGDAPSALDAIIHQDFARLRLAREAEDARIITWIEGLGDKAFSGRFTYITATDVRTVSQRLAPALAHFFNHQAHHRGQVHTVLTALGKPSLNLDLIAFQRTKEGLVYA